MSPPETRTSLYWTGVSYPTFFYWVTTQGALLLLSNAGHLTRSTPSTESPGKATDSIQTIRETKATSCNTWRKLSVLTVLPDLLRPIRAGGDMEMDNVLNSIITDREIHRCVSKYNFVSGSLYERNVLMAVPTN